MAMKSCPICGEKFSDTYRDCPFCEEEDALLDGEEIRRAPARRGRRVARSRQFSIITPMLIVLILIMAGLLAYLLYGDDLLGKIRGEEEDNRPPVQDIIEEDPTIPEEPVGDETNPEEGTMPEDPDTEDPATTEPDLSDYELTMKLPDGIHLSTTDFSLKKVGETHTIKITGGGSSAYSWVSEDDGIASVDSNGTVTAVSNGTVNVVATDGNKKGVCIVRVSASESASTGTQEPSGSGLKAGDGKVVNGGNGVRVRSGPSTNHNILATLANGSSLRIIESASDGWYKISFVDVGGVTKEGYMKGDYLANK